MATRKVQWNGMQEFRALLRTMPTHLRDQARDIVDHYTQITYSQVRQAYPVGDTGNLRKGVVIAERLTDAGVFNVVISKSPHAHLWEFGTVNRETTKGWDRGRVRPARDLGREGLVAIAQRNRIAMNRALIAMMRDDGFVISGALSAL